MAQYKELTMLYTLDTQIISYIFSYTLPETIFADSSGKYLKNESIFATNPIIQGECIWGFQPWIQYWEHENKEKRGAREIIMTNTLEFFERITKVWFHQEVYSTYGELLYNAKRKFWKKTKRFYKFYNDMWIWALCIGNNTGLITNNLKDFQWMKEVFKEFHIVSKDDFIRMMETY